MQGTALRFPWTAKPGGYPEPRFTWALDARAFLISYFLSLLEGEGRRR